MCQDQGFGLAPRVPADAGERPSPPDKMLEELRGTIVSGIDFGSQSLEVKGRDGDGRARWKLDIRGSARFTFSHSSEEPAWLVEANFDAGGTVRSSDRAMIHAICGARVRSAVAEEEGLCIRSDDGRAIEVPFGLNEDGIFLTILPGEDRSDPCEIVLHPAFDGEWCL